MLVEFVGESGCGKSTLARYIAGNEADIRMRPDVSNMSAMKLFIKNIHIKEYRKLFGLLYGSSLKSFKTQRLFKNALYIIKLLNIHFSDAIHGEGVLLFEQGLVQFLHTVFFYKEPDHGTYKNVLERICRNFQLYFVFCQCPDNVIQERIAKRSSSGAAGKRRIEDVADQPEILEHHKRIFGLFLKEIPQERIVCVDTSNELKDNGKLICEWIRRKYA